MESVRLDTRLGPLSVRCSGQGPALVFFAGALANGELWRDVVLALEDRFRCITVDLPLGGHRWPLAPGADRSAPSLARLLLDSVELLELDDATLIANDTAGGLLLLSLGSGHPGLARVGRLVLTNCESYDQFPPDALRKASALSRALPGPARLLVGMQLRSRLARRRIVAGVSAVGLDEARVDSFFGPGGRDPGVAGDLVAAMAGFRPELLLDAARAIPDFPRPVRLIWGDACEFFPVAHAQRLREHFPNATLTVVPGAKTWVPVDDPVAVAEGVAGLVPAPVA